MKDHPSTSHHVQDYAGRHVFPNDAEEIKAHKWFRDIQWDRLHMMVPPFVPNIKSVDDTHYFDEEDPISDFSESISGPPPTPDEISDALRPFNREIQVLAKSFVERPRAPRAGTNTSAPRCIGSRLWGCLITRESCLRSTSASQRRA